MGEVRKMGSQELWPSLFVSLFFIFASGVGLDPGPQLALTDFTIQLRRCSFT